MEFQKQLQTILFVSLITISLFALKPAAAENFIKKSCEASSYPDLCYDSLSQFADQVKNNTEKLAAVSVTFCFSKFLPVKAYIEELFGKTKEPRLSQALKDCVENFDDANDAIKDSIEQFKNITVPGAIQNVQTYMSAVSTCEDMCLDSMNDVPDGPEKKDVINRTFMVEKITGISLEMINLFADS